MGKNSRNDLEHIQQEMLERSAIEAPPSDPGVARQPALRPTPVPLAEEARDQAARVQAKVWKQVGQPGPEVVSELAEHWPDVELSSLEATQGDCAALRALLAQKYALSEQEAERHLQDWLAWREPQGA